MDSPAAPEGSTEPAQAALDEGETEPGAVDQAARDEAAVSTAEISLEEAAALERTALSSEAPAAAVTTSPLAGEAPPILVTAPREPAPELAAALREPLRTAAPWELPAAPWSPSTVLLGLVAVAVTAADLGSKEWAKHAVAGPDLKRTGKHIEILHDHIDIIFAQNPGGAWSFLRSVPDGLRRPFFLFVSAAAIVFIVTVYARLERRQWAMRWGLPLALGGAIGNLADRIRYGWVVDFIDIYWKQKGGEFHWPTFNVADVAIVVGVGLMALDLFSLRRLKPAAGDAAPETASGAA